MKQNKLFITSFILNLLVFLLVVAGTIVMFTIGSGALGNKGLTVFKYFTFQSNLFCGAVVFVYAYYQYLMIKGKKKEIPHVLKVFNHVAVTAVGVTFLVVVAFLAPGYGFDKMYNKANLFFHALVPLTAMVNYLFFEKETGLSFKWVTFCIIPCILYGLVYLIVVASLNAYGNLEIDFYGFGKNGLGIGILNYFIIVSISYGIGVFLYFINRVVFKKRK